MGVDIPSFRINIIRIKIKSAGVKFGVPVKFKER
jgi:hypothetical protein